MLNSELLTEDIGEHTSDFLGFGNKDKKDVKAQLESMFGKGQWRKVWSAYKKAGGDKRTLDQAVLDKVLGETSDDTTSYDDTKGGGYTPPPSPTPNPDAFNYPPPPPPEKSKTGWIIGGIAGGVLVLGTATFFIVRAMNKK